MQAVTAVVTLSTLGAQHRTVAVLRMGMIAITIMDIGVEAVIDPLSVAL